VCMCVCVCVCVCVYVHVCVCVCVCCVFVICVCVVCACRGTAGQWLVNMLNAFNKGDIAEFEKVSSDSAAAINQQPALVGNAQVSHMPRHCSTTNAPRRTHAPLLLTDHNTLPPSHAL